MRPVLRSLLLLASAGLVVSIAIAAKSPSDPPQSDADDSAAVARVVEDYHKALSTADSARALNLLASDAVILESGGVETRAEYRSHHLSGDIQFAKAVESKRGPLHVTIEGDAAWTSSTSTAQGTFNGRAINSLGAESMVLTRSAEGGWRIRAIHWSSRTRRAAAP